LGKIEMNAIGV